MYTIMGIYVAKNSAQNTVDREIRLIGVGLSVCIALFLWAAYMISMFFSNLDLISLELFYTFTCDIFNEINPYSLIFLCSDVKIHLKKYLGLKTDNKVHVKPIVVKAQTSNATK